MVQKEVLKKTKTYGFNCITFSYSPCAMIYAYGNPGISPGAPQQPGSSGGTQETLSQGNLGTQALGTQSSMKTFYFI